MSNTTLLTAAIDAQIAAAHALVAAQEAHNTNVTTFRLSAEAMYAAVSGGVEAKALATAATDAITSGRAPKGSLYTSAAAVGYHAMTGRALRLTGELGQINTPYGMVDVMPQDVQAKIKKVGQKISAALVKAAETDGRDITWLMRELIKADKVAKQDKAAKSDDESNESDNAPADDAKSVAELIAAATSILVAAVKRDDWTADDINAAKVLADGLVRRASVATAQVARTA